MPSQSNISRPYARALFDLAKESGQLVQWQQQLDLLVTVTIDIDFIKVAESPYVSGRQHQQLIVDVCQGKLTDQAINLVKLLIKNDRLSAVQDIAQAYAVLKAKADQVIQAKMVTATEIDERHQQRFSDALKKNFDKSVTVAIEFDVDETLLGGAIISTGDWVIDGSLRAQLDQLKSTLGA